MHPKTMASAIRSTGLFGRLLTGVLAVAIALAPATAQESGTGSITGRVLNASNGTYLPKAVVTVEGTSLSALTDDSGSYTIRNVPAGDVNVRASFTGQQPQTVRVTVAPGVAAQADLALGRTTNLRADGSIELDPFVVASERYKTAADIAINEERHSVNIKNVVAADQFGEIPSGNVGEFIKFLPGVEIEYGQQYTAPTDPMGISVRGFGSADTAIYVDGVPIASASQGSLTTQIGLDMMSINNASRVELIKVATPDMPMNSVGGQINLISRSAFEYAKPTLTAKAYVTINSENPNPFERIVGPSDEKVFAAQPGFELSYVRPINDRLGITLSASRFSQYSEFTRFRSEWGTSNVNVDLRPFGGANNTPATNANGPVSPSNPYLSRVSIYDSPRTSLSHSASIKADWRPFDGLTLSATYQASQYESVDTTRRIQIRTQRPQIWDATQTISYPFLTAGQLVAGQPQFNPGNNISMFLDARDKEGMTHTGSFRATYRKGPWDIFALASASTSRATFKDLENDHFSNVEINADSLIGQVRFESIVDGIPGRISVMGRNGQPFDFSRLANWNTAQIQARSGLAESMDDVFNYKLDVKRDLDFLPWQDQFRVALKAGFLREETLKKKWGRGTNYRETYTGPAITSNDYLDTTYVGETPGYGLKEQEWISVYRLYDIYQANPSSFSITEADARENWNSAVGQNKRVKETRDAIYAMFEGSMLPHRETNKHRLHFVAGLRDESLKRRGQGPMGDSKWNYIKEADGTLYRNSALTGTTAGTVRIDQANSLLFAQTAAGTALRADLTSKGIAFPTSVIANNTLASQMLQRRMLQPVDGESDGKPSYSINLAYDISDKLVGKVAYSRTFGRIPIEDTHRGLLSGNQNDFNINEAEDPTAIPAGTIKVANPNLLPEIADNWDFALTYYTDRGGKLGASFYYKTIENFNDEIITFSSDPTFSETLTSLGLDPADYQDWQLTTSINGIGSAKVRGFEFEVFQDLRFIPWLGDYGRRVNFFATYSKSKRSETNTERISSRPAASQLATGGINVSLNRLTVNLKATWSDLKRTDAAGSFTIGGVTYELGEYEPSNTKVDLYVNYQLSKRYSIYLTGRDIFKTGQVVERFDLAGIYPGYAHWDDQRHFGTQVTIGVKGTW